jgi:hypothetical protein
MEFKRDAASLQACLILAVIDLSFLQLNNIM